ncbi:hypothetical protein BK138_28975 [Paenibacillus rhizosphaerae]|uniref:Uncharacterized protein n=1 Tax=Paenibacillus rhizosphaerae TaxID=297318 RepID=A0A1R1ECJ3_9BACL|nr:hypothetical protein BK138_28975 [Paenibacillus rhizosphaerae]
MPYDYKKRQQKIIAESKSIDPDYHDANFVFCRENGYPFIQNNILIRMNRLLQRTSIKKRPPLISSDIPISACSQAEVDLKTIMKRVGHDGPKTTLKI